MDCVDCNNDGNLDDGTRAFDDCGTATAEVFDSQGRAVIEFVSIQMKTNVHRQGEGIDFGEGTAEVYMWSSTFDHLENQMVERAVGLPCVQEVGRTYEYSFQIGAVAIGQGIRVGAWEWDDDTGWSDDSLGDKWILPEDFEQSDPLLTLNTFKDTTFTLRCRGCSQLTGTKPEPFISENPAQTWTVDDLIDEAKEQTGVPQSDNNGGDGTLLALWNYDPSTGNALHSIPLYSWSFEEETENSEMLVTLDITCPDCYLGVSDGTLIIDYETDPLRGFDKVAAEVTADFKLNADFLLRATA
eukprot:gene5701-6890_t